MKDFGPKLYNRELEIFVGYAPTDDSNQDIKDVLEESLAEPISKISNRKKIIIMGDFNARTGSKINDAIVGRFGLEIVNNNGTRIMELC